MTSNPRIKFLLALFVLGGSILGTRGQGSFQNLNFESAVPPLNPTGTAIEQAMPGWAAYLGDEPTFIVYINGVSLGGASVGLRDSSAASMPSLIGSYSAELFDGLPPSMGGDGKIASLGQTGTIPAGTLSLRFVATSLSPVVSFAGNTLAVQQVGNTARYNIFAGDISSFAGQTGELRFSQTGLFDQVSFSTVAVPEPGTMALLLAGGLLFHFTRMTAQPPAR